MRELFKALFPIKAGDCELVVLDEDRYLDAARMWQPLESGQVVMQFLLYEEHRNQWGEKPLRDIKEQVIKVVLDPTHNRLEDLLLGWASALEEILLNPKLYPDTLLPADFMPDRSAFNLKTAKTAEDYKRAFLVKSRLGRLVTR